MSTTVTLDQIRTVLPNIDLLPLIEKGFVEYSSGQVVVPPVGEMLFEDPPGDVHIKYGFIKGGDYYVIKVASGFYRNPAIGLASSQGLMLLFNQKTGVLVAILLDEGFLTDIRTAAAGAVAARHLAPKAVDRIGIIGAGTQARVQLEHLCAVTACRNVVVWTPEPAEFEPYRASFVDANLQIECAETPSEVASRCHLIVTTTPSTQPLLRAADVQAGTHITAVGSDTAEKIELESELLARADVVVVDSLPQSESRGEVFRAVSDEAISRNDVYELGAVIAGNAVGRADNNQITVCDLTGVAVQDLQIARAVYEAVAVETNRRPR